jgi:hypothetical protein
VFRQSPEEDPGSDVLRNEGYDDTSHHDCSGRSFILETTQAVVRKHEFRMREELKMIRIRDARVQLEDLHALVQSR